VRISQKPGPPFVILERDLVARITKLDEIMEEDFMFSVPPVEELTDLLPGQPQTVWPIEAIPVPRGVFSFEAILIPQGLLSAVFPGRLTAIDLHDPARTEYVISESTQHPGGSDPTDRENTPRSYHNAVLYDLWMATGSKKISLLSGPASVLAHNFTHRTLSCSGSRIPAMKHRTPMWSGTRRFCTADY
jgi:hypothetical protein